MGPASGRPPTAGRAAKGPTVAAWLRAGELLTPHVPRRQPLLRGSCRPGPEPGQRCREKLGGGLHVLWRASVPMMRKPANIGASVR
eukprot:4307977-Alexandrium_andersonii.AAC.1